MKGGEAREGQALPSVNCAIPLCALWDKQEFEPLFADLLTY